MKKLMDFPEWQAATRRLGELQNELTETEAAHAAGLEALGNEPTRADKLTEKAKRLLGGGADERPNRAEKEREIETMAERRRVLVRAIEIHRGVMATMQSGLSRAICKELKPGYQALVKNLAAAVDALALAAEAERMFREELRDGGVQFASSIPAVPLRGGWDRRDDYSPASMFHREAKASGYL